MEDKKKSDKYSREIAMPPEVSERYERYCKATKMKLSEPLRVLVMESVPQLRNPEKLGATVARAKRGNGSKKFHVRLPDDVIHEIQTYCAFFQVKRCHFLYCLIEDKLGTVMEDVLGDG